MISVEEIANTLRICDEAHNWQATWNELATSVQALIISKASAEWAVRIGGGPLCIAPDEEMAREWGSNLSAAVVESRLITEWSPVD